MEANIVTSIIELVLFATAMGSFVLGVYSYLKMMAEISPGIDTKALCARYKIRANLLFIRCPDIFTNKGVYYRRWYITSFVVFVVLIFLGGLLACIQF